MRTKLVIAIPLGHTHRMKWPSRSNLWHILWLGVLLLLFASLIDVAPRSAMRTSRKVREMAAVKDIQLGIKNFEAEYNVWPVLPSTSVDHDLETEVSGPLLACLMGGKAFGNVREIPFVEPPMAHEGKRGLIESKGAYQLLDTWGRSYRVVIDSNGDKKIDNPDLKNSDAEIRSGSTDQHLLATVAVMCAGPDGTFYTRDDIVSWRNSPSDPEPKLQWWTQLDVLLALIACGMILYSAVGLIVTRGE